MRTRRPDGRDRTAFLLIALALIGGAAGFAWATEPPSAGANRGRSVGSAVATQDGRGAAAFCGLVLTQPALSPTMGTAYALSGEGGRPLLTSLAAEWGRTGSAGAREQVAVQCRREGLGS